MIFEHRITHSNSRLVISFVYTTSNSIVILSSQPTIASIGQKTLDKSGRDTEITRQKCTSEIKHMKYGKYVISIRHV